MMSDNSAAERSDKTGTISEIQLRKQLSRESHRRWLLLQRLNVLEKQNLDIKSKALSICQNIKDSPSGTAPDKLKVDRLRPRLTQHSSRIRRSSCNTSEDWKAMATHCLALAKSNASIRIVLSSMLEEKQVIDCRLRRLSESDSQLLANYIRKLSSGRPSQEMPIHLQLASDQIVRRFSASGISLGPLKWRIESPELADLIRSSEALQMSDVMRYIELSQWHDSKQHAVSSVSCTDSDPATIRNLGFSLALNSRLVYIFDEPDSKKNVGYVVDTSTGRTLIKSATMSKLIEKLIDPVRPVDRQVQWTLLITHPMVMSSIDIMELLVQRCNIPYPPNMTPNELARFSKTIIAPIQHRCLTIWGDWLEQFPSDIIDNDEVVSMLEQQLNDMAESGEIWVKDPVNSLIELIAEKRRKTGHQEGPVLPLPESSSEGANLAFSDISDETFVQTICLEDYKVFKAITAREFLSQTWSKGQSKAPNIMGMISRFNKMTFFVQNQILRQELLPKRITVLKRFILLAKEFRLRKNYNAVFAIYASLNANAIHRLKHTWEGLPIKHRSSFDDLKKLFSVVNNCKALRAEMKMVVPPCIPHLGLTLQDLTFIGDGNPDFVMHGMINMQKLAMIADRIQWVRDCQKVPYNTESVPKTDIRKFLDQESVVMDEETLWQLSQMIEPRQTKT